MLAVKEVFVIRICVYIIHEQNTKYECVYVCEAHNKYESFKNVSF